MDSDYHRPGGLPDPSLSADRTQTEVSWESKLDSNSSTDVFILDPCSLPFLFHQPLQPLQGAKGGTDKYGM